MNEEFLQLIERARSGDLEARNQIIEDSQGIINNVCKKLYKVNCDESAKRYGALIGILCAIRKYDGVSKWEPYAFCCAYNKAIGEVSDEYLVRKPRYLIQQNIKDDQNPCPTISLNGHFDRDEWNDDEDQMPVWLMRQLAVHVEMPETECLNLLDSCIKDLTELERDAIYHKFKYEKTSLKQLGEKHKVSHEWIRMKASSVYKKLKFSFLKQLKKKEKIWAIKSS